MDGKVPRSGTLLNCNLKTQFETEIETCQKYFHWNEIAISELKSKAFKCNIANSSFEMKSKHKSRKNYWYH